MSGRPSGSAFHYCTCRDPETGRQLGKACPLLGNSRHRKWGYVRRIPTTAAKAWQLYRRGFDTKGAAEDELGRVAGLLRIAGDDDRTRARIGDLIRTKTHRGGQLPTEDEVRLRLGAGDRLDQVQTVAEYLETWLAGKRRARPSTLWAYEQHIRRVWVPALGDYRLDQLRADHVNAAVAELLQRETNRAAGTLTAASVSRYLATLRSALGAAVKAHRIRDNAAAGIELPEHQQHQVDPWTPEEATAFLTAHQGERLLALFELVMVEGLRRGEVLALRWDAVDLERGIVRVQRNRVEVAGRVVEGDPKTKSGARTLGIGAGSRDALVGWRLRQQLEAAEWGAGWTDSGYVFTREDGQPLRPEFVSKRFKALAAEAGLRVIRFHDLRHTAASLGLAAGTDRTVVSKRLGHATTRITDDLYTHLYEEVGRAASDASAGLLRRDPQTPV